MSTWSTRAAVRGTGPPWSLRNPELLRMSRSPSQCSSAVSPPPQSMMDLSSEPGTVDWLQECQLSSHGDLTVTERLATLLDTGQFSDVTIRVGQGTDYTTFKAHRLLLATASQPLYRLVSTVQYGHADLNTFRVTDVEPATFKSVLQFIYTDKIAIGSVVEAFSLLKAGKKWGLKKMNVKTTKYLEEFLNEFTPSIEEKKNDIFDLLLLANSHSTELFDKCLNIVLEYAKDIIPCQGFLRLDSKTIRRLLGHPNFKFDDQLGLFEAIRDWGMNQILLKGLNPTQLHPIIEDLLTHVDFEKIKDNDFVGTILPSDCLGRAEVIAFFMTRGMEIPRDMGFNNNKQDSSMMQNGEVKDFKKVCRYKKGYRLPHKEIYHEHDLRFRVDKNIKLLGVGFGFLFSNTDMGVTLHCQGPWEKVQWTDITQTYCRVSWEKMRSADLRLMFSEPVKLEANHSYKVMVRITRMTSGSTDVELWGGQDGSPFIEADDAIFYFIKAAVDRKKEVDTREMDSKQGMITELLYIIDDSPPCKTEEVTVRSRRPDPEPEDKPQEEVTKSLVRKRSLVTEDEPIATSSLARRRESGGTYLRWQHPTLSTSTDSTRSSYTTKDASRSPDSKTMSTLSTSTDASSYFRRRPSVEEPRSRSSYTNKDKSPDPKTTETTSYYTRKRPSPVREPKYADTSSFLKSKTLSTATSERFAETPSFLKSKTTTTPTSDTPWGDRQSRASTRTSGPSSWASSRSTTTNTDLTSTATTTSRYGRGTTSSTTTSRYGREPSTPTKDSSSLYSTTTSRYGREPSTLTKDTSSLYSTTTSRYGRDSTTNKDSSAATSTTSRYGRDSSTNKDSSAATSATSRYGRDSSTNKDSSAATSITSRYGRDSSTNKDSGLSTSTISRYSRESSAAKDSSTPSYRRESLTGSSTRRESLTGTTSTPDSSAIPGTSMYRSSSTIARLSRDLSASRYGSMFGRDRSASRYGTSTGSSYGTSSSTSPSYGSSYSSSRFLGSSYSRYR